MRQTIQVLFNRGGLIINRDRYSDLKIRSCATIMIVFTSLVSIWNISKYPVEERRLQIWNLQPAGEQNGNQGSAGRKKWTSHTTVAWGYL